VIVPQQPIIFFDDVCGICNTFVNVMLKADRRGIFKFAPLQGETAKRLLPPLSNDPKDWSMIYLDEQGMHDQLDASMAVYRRLGGLWTILSWGRFVPKFIATPCYRIFARNRYKVFGKRDACRVPSAAERARFLP
jgi:predicted DCC family thiol-disulfide oxidoreductase YuxK